MTDEEIMNYRFRWPEWIYEIFPALFIFYRETKAKPRTRTTGYRAGKKINPVTGKPFDVKVKEPYKKASTNGQNNYSVCTCVLTGPDDYGTVARSLKHKGFSKLVGVFYATQEEAERAKKIWRFIFSKYKAFSELYNVRRVNDPNWKILCDELEKIYRCKSTGQLRLL